MRKKDFDRLKQSVIEAGKIMRGEMKPSREFKIKVSRQKSSTGFVFCVETDDPQLLIPHKVYQASFFEDIVTIKDEAGETAAYPSEFFIRLALPEEVEQVLLKAA
jgi:hypothetical protein